MKNMSHSEKLIMFKLHYLKKNNKKIGKQSDHMTLAPSQRENSVFNTSYIREMQNEFKKVQAK